MRSVFIPPSFFDAALMLHAHMRLPSSIQGDVTLGFKFKQGNAFFNSHIQGELLQGSDTNGMHSSNLIVGEDVTSASYDIF